MLTEQERSAIGKGFRRLYGAYDKPMECIAVLWGEEDLHELDMQAAEDAADERRKGE